MKKKRIFSLALLGFLLSLSASDISAADLYLNQPLASGVYATESGGVIAQDGCVVNTGASVILVADHFHFLPGFNVQAGASLITLFADYDGMDDAWEVGYFGDLNSAVAGEDLDGDTLNNLQESQHQTNPHSSDTDSDLMPDAWEVANSLNPIVNDAAGDPDGDNFSNHSEYLVNTDPNDEYSLPIEGYYYEYDSLGRIKKIILIRTQ